MYMSASMLMPIFSCPMWICISMYTYVHMYICVSVRRRGYRCICTCSCKLTCTRRCTSSSLCNLQVFVAHTHAEDFKEGERRLGHRMLGAPGGSWAEEGRADVSPLAHGKGHSRRCIPGGRSRLCFCTLKVIIIAVIRIFIVVALITYAYIYIYTYMYTYAYVCAYIYMYICVYVPLSSDLLDIIITVVTISAQYEDDYGYPDYYYCCFHSKYCSR